MLQRIASALISNIKPVTSPANQTAVGKQGDKSDNRKQKKRELKLVKTEDPQATTKASKVEQTYSDLELDSQIDKSVTSTFVQLISLLQSKKALIAQWLCLQLYQSSGASQKKAGKLKKGTMLDEKIE